MGSRTVDGTTEGQSCECGLANPSEHGVSDLKIESHVPISSQLAMSYAVHLYSNMPNMKTGIAPVEVFSQLLTINET